MTVRVNHDEDRGIYALGDDIDGVFIEFVTLADSAVQGRIDSLLVHEQNTDSPPAANAKPEPVADEYTDNGDGTYTRSSNGATGHFTPTGFAANPQA